MPNTVDVIHGNIHAVYAVDGLKIRPPYPIAQGREQSHEHGKQSKAKLMCISKLTNADIIKRVKGHAFHLGPPP